MAHVLVVGGTGMLKKVSLFLAEHDNVVTVIARTAKDLEDLKEEAKKFSGRINPLAIDYRNIDQLRARLEDAVEAHGAVTLTVSWIRPDALHVSGAVAEVLDRTSPVCRYFQVLPGADGQAVNDSVYYDDPFREFDRVLYRTIVLGYKVEQGMSRWLGNDEICGGIIDALRNDRRNAVIGEVEPWEQRPVSA